MENLIIFFIFIISIFNFYCIYNSSIDWDTANHLYDAKLKFEKKKFKSNYNFGIKFILPYIYKVFWPIIQKNLKIYSLINIITFTISFILLTYIILNYTDDYFLYVVFTLLVLNLTVFNPQTSATEFLSTLFVVLSYYLYLMDSNYIYLSISLIIILSLLFKLTDIFFLLPFCFEVIDHLLGISILFSFLLFILYFSFKDKFLYLNKKLINYFLSRSLKKHLQFNLKNFVFIIFFLIILFLNLRNSENFDKYIIFSGILVFIFQRGYVSYFYYPLLILNLFILIKNNNLDLTNNYFFISFLILVIYFLITFLINLKYRDAEVTFRILHDFSFYRVKQLKSDKEFFDKIKKTINNNFYLWGSRTLCCLVTKYDQTFDEYVSHNHIVYWSQISDKRNYCEKNCLKYKPDFIIESGIISDIGNLTSKIKNNYQPIFENETGTIYKKLNEKI